ncbi:MAG: F0F1 ATP synthase subunit delta [Actinomycetaceae bacterium]|nr:F0F1 ATP synthase subunit delta [Actinomycetaceae bacterium]
MRAASATALGYAKQRLLDSFEQITDPEKTRLIGDQFLWLSDTLQSSAKLSEALTSTTRSGSDKHRLIDTAFSGGDKESDVIADKITHLHPVVIDVLKELSAHSWSDAKDLAEACEQLGFFTILSAAKETKRLELIQADLCQIDRVLKDNRALRNALAMRSRPVKDRTVLAFEIFDPVVSGPTMLLLRRIIARTPSGRLLAAIRDLRLLTAEAQGKELAVIHTAIPLTQSQLDRLQILLSKKCGRPVHIDIEIDPEVIGGMRIRLGADLYEGTLAASLQQARTRLAG